MKQNPYLLLFILFIFTLTGCMQYTIPKSTNRVSDYQLTTDDFKIIGVVEAEGEIHNILFFIWGGDGFSIILKKAKEIGGDDIINYHFDMEITGMPGVICSQKWVASATVIRYTDKAIDRKLFKDNMTRKIISEQDAESEHNKKKVIFDN